MTDAKQLTLTLRGQWYGRYGVAPCPVCQPEARRDQNALTLSDGANGLLAHCKKSDCDFRDILASAGIERECTAAVSDSRNSTRAHANHVESDKRAKQAHRLWQEAQPVAGTLAETYLRNRCITCLLPVTLRFAPACWHPTAQRFPAMVALVVGGDGFAVHRTYLRADGLGKAGVEPAKAMLGATAGGAVRLSEGPGPLVVAEGVETAMSLRCGLLRGPATVWAALSTSGIRGLRLPPEPGRLTIAPDGDTPGRDAAHALAERADALGWQVSLLSAPAGRDWNDILAMKGKAA